MGSSKKFLQPYKDGVRLEVYLQPKASRSEIVGLYGEALKIKVKAPPVEGKANKALLLFLADLLGLPRRRLEIISGLTSRRKSIYISQANLDAVQKALELKIDEKG